MSQSVDRLKELLFDNETKSLSHLEKQLQALTQSETEKRAELGRRIDEVFERAGTQERFLNNVAAVIDGALRKAEIERHGPLADAIAPLVVRTIKNEIRNSKDELVETLYPMTGRMVQAYVASAMKDLANDLNRRLDANPVMLRVRSLVTGKSVAELALAETQRFTVEELYLVRRGTGELIGRWPESSDLSGRDHVMSGILAAINDFSSAALSDEGSTLRRIDLGERHLYLRASPLLLLAAKCAGTAPTEVEAVLDDAFLTALEKIQQAGGDADKIADNATSDPTVLGSVSAQLEKSVGGKAPISPLKILAWMIGLPLAAWLSWSFYADYRKDRAHSIASEVIARSPAVAGYPIQLDAGDLGQTITVTGLAPSADVREALVSRLRSTLPSSEIRDHLSVLPNALEIMEPQIARLKRELSGLEPEIGRVREEVSGIDPKITTMRDALARIEPEVAKVQQSVSTIDPRVNEVGERVAKIEPEVAKVQGEVKSLEQEVQRALIERLVTSAAKRMGEASNSMSYLVAMIDSAQSRDKLRAIVEDIGQARAAAEAELKVIASKARPSDDKLAAKIDTIAQMVAASADQLGELMGATATAKTAGNELRSSLTAAAESLAAETDRLAAHSVALGHVFALKRSLPKPTAREELEAWTRSNAIFFGDATEYRNAARASAALDTLASLILKGDDLVRIVGYTDEKGTIANNSPLSLNRAEKVRGELLSRGVPEHRLVAVGRLDAQRLSPQAGETSPSRRVEFEVGFVGEGQE
jgi:outer membrane protein OmpA-like peptidoglycan-associated protein